MLNASYTRMAHELAYREHMHNMARDDENRAFWDGACTAARQIIHAMQDEGESYPWVFKRSETEYYTVYLVSIGSYKAEVMLEK